VLIGIIVAAATGGALVGFGLLSGTPYALFNAIAAVFLGVRAQGLVGFQALVTPLGMLAHWGLATLWSVAYAHAAQRMRGARVPLAIGMALADFVLVTWVARLAGAGLGIVLPLGQRLVFGLVLAAALLVGMRLARAP
jgi:hypothetical protein